VGFLTKIQYRFLVSPTQGKFAALIHLIAQEISGEYDLNLAVYKVGIFTRKTIQMDIKFILKQDAKKSCIK
jgi:hypothetical protein